MPVLKSSYEAPVWGRSGHLQTVLAAGGAGTWEDVGERVRIRTEDEDFVDAFPRRGGHSRAVVVCHGLEGDVRRGYVLASVAALAEAGWDVWPWCYRGCSGVPNLKVASYHSGMTEDLARVVEKVRGEGYDEVALLGFSIGGNQVLKYVGEREDAGVSRVVAVSVPTNLRSSAEKMASPGNRVYMAHFLKALRRKVRAKAEKFPGELDLSGLEEMRTFADFDARYTAPQHGFRDIYDYWEQASSGRVLAGISVPTLLLMAEDDPILTPECFPYAVAEESEVFELEVARHGGHVGFYEKGGGRYFCRRAVEFLGAGDRGGG